MAHLFVTPGQGPPQCPGLLCLSLFLEEASILSPLFTHPILACMTWLLLSALPLRWTPRCRIPTFTSDSGLCLLASAHIEIGKNFCTHMSWLEPTKARLVLVFPPFWQWRFRYSEAQTCSWRTNTKAVSKEGCQGWATQPNLVTMEGARGKKQDPETRSGSRGTWEWKPAGQTLQIETP